MTDTNTPNGWYAETSTTYTVDGNVIDTAVKNGLLAQEPIELGDNAIAIPLPAGWNVHVSDERQYEDNPRERQGAFPFVGVRSLGQYVMAFRSEHTLGYLSDVNGRGPEILTKDLHLAKYVIDDFATDAFPGAPVANRRHTATLVLRPTAQARRWGAALSTILNQEQMLDLIDDGIGEIAKPPAADLRELISDLHAIRTTEAQSVIRTGGAASITVADAVNLHSGKGTEVTVPERMTIVFVPFASLDNSIVLDIKIKPIVGDRGKVVFQLSAPTLDTQLTRLVSSVAEQLTEVTGIEPLWTV